MGKGSKNYVYLVHFYFVIFGDEFYFRIDCVCIGRALKMNKAVISHPDV